MDLDVLAEAWRGRMARQRVIRLKRANEARAAARRAAIVLRAEFAVEEVWLFGSLVSGPRHDAFDIDLAVRGLQPDLYYEALSRVSDLVGGPVDLVQLESCSDRLRHTVATTAERIDHG